MTYNICRVRHDGRRGQSNTRSLLGQAISSSKRQRCTCVCLLHPDISGIERTVGRESPLSDMPSDRSCGAWDTQLQQQEKFTVCISNNVREYGGGSTCLKELLANADDAKATKFTICLDQSQYQTDGLLSPGMAGLQGLALWVGNDAKFSSQDWRNYTLHVGRSAKANDNDTIGKFGKGGLTAYSLSDVIQVVSGDHMLVLDPHGTHLPNQLQSWQSSQYRRQELCGRCQGVPRTSATLLVFHQTVLSHA